MNTKLYEYKKVFLLDHILADTYVQLRPLEDNSYARTTYKQMHELSKFTYIINEFFLEPDMLSGVSARVFKGADRLLAFNYKIK